MLRLSKLKPQYGPLYPDLPAGHWMPAWQAATCRAEHVWQEAGAEALIRERLLSDEHFDFRGGSPRPLDWYVAPERLSDPTVAEAAGAWQGGD